MPYPDWGQFTFGMKAELTSAQQVDRKSKIAWQEIDCGVRAFAAIARWPGEMKNSC
jgi:hypothetical protein